MDNSVLTLRDLLAKKKSFLIPYYQRGYIWGKSRGDGNDSVSYILDSIKTNFDSNKELFLQGITVTENDTICLIDGQQRMTFFFILLCFFERKFDFSIEYAIRKESQKFLEELRNSDTEGILKLCKKDENEEFQDIFFFKKTVRLINEKLSLSELDAGRFFDFIMEKVKFLYVPIRKENATEVFSMMNGNKAEMKDEELVKAEILRLISKEDANFDSDVAWEQKELRAKYAREWDRWLHFWNRKDIQVFYHTDNVMMGWLLKTYFATDSKKIKDQKHIFYGRLVEKLNGNEASNIKNVFYELRSLQKKFEDVFNSICDGFRLHNKIGSILCLLTSKDRESFIVDYFNNKFSEDIGEYYKYAFLTNLSHKVIANALKKDSDAKNKIEEQIDATIEAFEDNNLYESNPDCAYRQLMRLNIEYDTELGRAFDFSIWENKSLEHVFPKSKAKSLKQDKIVHSIGNLVLLYGKDNSSFGNKSFDEKKQRYFERDNRMLMSRSLLHTLSVFARDKWDESSIKENKKKMIVKLKTYYGRNKR